MISMRGWRLARWSAVVGALALLVLASNGCRSMLEGREHQQRMDEISAEIQAEIATDPDVTGASVGYSDHFQDPGPVAGATIFVRSGADPDAIADEAVRLIWLSRLDPLHAITVSVQNATTNRLAATRVLYADGEHRPDLESRYGPRPSEPSE